MHQDIKIVIGLWDGLSPFIWRGAFFMYLSFSFLFMIWGHPSDSRKSESLGRYQVVSKRMSKSIKLEDKKDYGI